MLVEMRLSRIIISDIHDHQIVYLKESEGEREFPIVIGRFEASSIDRRVKKEQLVPRPLTHDLIVSTVQALGGELDCIKIHDMRDATYFASICVKKDGEVVEIDSRPSDAIAVAVTSDPFLPIYVEDSVIEAASEDH